MTNTPETWALYAAAAECLNNGDAMGYEAVRAQSPFLDWDGHDRRALRLAGVPYEQMGPDPALAHLLSPSKPPMTNDEYHNWKLHHPEQVRRVAKAFLSGSAANKRKRAA